MGRIAVAVAVGLGCLWLSGAAALAADTSDSYNLPQFDVPSRVYSRGQEDNGGSGGKRQPVAPGQVFSTQLDGRCVDITNNSGQTIYFPTTSGTEASDFLNNAGKNIPGVSIGPCTYKNMGWSQWSTCTATCGGGTTGRVLDCRKSIGEVITGDECAANCNGGESCAPQVACNTDPCIPVTPPPDPPPEQKEPPTAFCFFFVSGLLVNNHFVESWYSKIGTTDMYSNFVGPGDYSTATPFATATKYTFDGLAFGKDTHVTIYRGANFTGGTIIDEQGPAVINNNYWITQPQTPEPGQWLTNVWPDEFNAQFPPSSRRWSASNMWDWGQGTSIKVTCNK